MYKSITITHEIQCSRCGKRKVISLNPDTSNSILKVAHKWSTTGWVLYCPSCTKNIIKTYTTDYEDVLSAMLDYIIR